VTASRPYTGAMRQVQVRGCLPAVIMLLLLGGLVALVIFASLAVALPVAAALLVLGLARSLWYRLMGRTPPSRAATFQTFRVGLGRNQATRTGPVGDEGPVVDALPRPGRSGAPGSTEAPAVDPKRESPGGGG
jgi:hypothetical protein